jgi:hypothetical protein
MDFTDTQQEILVDAWLLAREGKARLSRTGQSPTRKSSATPAGSNAAPSTLTGIPAGSGHKRPRRRSTWPRYGATTRRT